MRCPRQLLAGVRGDVMEEELPEMWGAIEAGVGNWYIDRIMKEVLAHLERGDTAASIEELRTIFRETDSEDLVDRLRKAAPPPEMARFIQLGHEILGRTLAHLEQGNRKAAIKLLRVALEDRVS